MLDSFISIYLIAVQMSMPDFHTRMKDRLRTVEEGADTIVWLALSDSALKEKNGQFFQGMLYEQY